MRCERTSTKAPSHDIGRPPEVMHNSFPRTCRIYPSPLRPLELGLTAYSQLTPTKALYPIPVRQLLGLLSPSSPPRLTTAQLGSASSSANSVYAETFTRQELCRARHTIYIYIYIKATFSCESSSLQTFKNAGQDSNQATKSMFQVRDSGRVFNNEGKK